MIYAIALMVVVFVCAVVSLRPTDDDEEAER